MLKKLITSLSVCLLLAAGTSCVDSDPLKNQNKEPDKEQEKDPDPQPGTDPDTGTDTGTENTLPTALLSIKETIANMGAGWNLGNTLESNSGDTARMWIEAWTDRMPADYEKAWGQAPATRELMHMMREGGFRAIRVPVTWYPHMVADFGFKNGEPLWSPTLNPLGYKVDEAWMARVKQVVDYVLAEDMYCILNVHHDTGTSNTHWLVASEENYAQNNERFKSLWTQIAETFKDYDGRLLFEGYNEMTDQADSWCFASFGTPEHYDAAVAASAYNAINSYAQDFVDAVRATGGNNATRNLIVNTYAACSGEGDWNSHLLDPLKEMKMPYDSTEGHIGFQVHFYPTFTTLAQGKKTVDTFINTIQTKLASKGAPVIVGEWANGGGDGISYDTRRTDYLSFAEYFVRKAKENGMATFYWMGISDGAEDRSAPRFTQPDLKEAIIRGAK